MPRLMGMCLILVLGLLVASCGGGGNSDAPRAGNVHQPGWILVHDERAREDLVGCQVCHGVNFEGHGNAVSCFRCHFGGGPPFLKHPPKQVERLAWGNPVNHGFWAEQFLFRCQGCHAQATASGIPRFNRSYPGMEQGCESTEGCHSVSNEPVSDPAFQFLNNGHNFRVAHPSFDPSDALKQDPLHWYGTLIPYTDDQGVQRTYPITHLNAGNVQESCTPCHGANLEGVSVDGVAIPACRNCHVRSPLEEPANCVSCHGSPVSDVPVEGLDPEFLSQLPTTQHMQVPHPFLSAAQVAVGCGLCHPSGDEDDNLPPDDPNRVDNQHHVKDGTPIPPGSPAPFPPNQPGEVYACFSCHTFEFAGGQFTTVVYECEFCHSAPEPVPLGQ